MKIHEKIVNEAAPELPEAEPKVDKITSYMDDVDDVKRERDHEQISELITKYFSHKLFNLVSDFQMKKSQEQIYAEEIVGEQSEESEYSDDQYGYESEPGLQEDLQGPSKDEQKKYIEQRKRREQQRRLREL